MRRVFIILVGLGSFMLATGGAYADDNTAAAQDYKKSGETQQANGDVSAALVEYNNAINLEPDDAEAYFLRGSAREAKYSYDGAIADFTRAIALNSKNPQAYSDRGLARIYKNQLAQAVDCPVLRISG